jgi:hypothetical protein
MTIFDKDEAQELMKYNPFKPKSLIIKKSSDSLIGLELNTGVNRSSDAFI